MALRPRDFFYRDVAFFHHSSKVCCAILKALLSLALKHTTSTRRHGTKYTRYRGGFFCYFVKLLEIMGKSSLAFSVGCVSSLVSTRRTPIVLFGPAAKQICNFVIFLHGKIVSHNGACCWLCRAPPWLFFAGAVSLLRYPH